MPKSRKDRRAKTKSSAAGSSAGAGACNQTENAAKQSESDSESLQSPVSDRQDSIFSLRRILPLLAFVALAVFDVLVITARTETEDDGTHAHDDLHSTTIDARIPRIDGMEINRDSWDKTRNFLDNFVCNYHPSTESNGIADTEGYCHPRLSAAPQHRTQRVSFSQSPPDISGSESIPIILKEVKKDGQKSYNISVAQEHLLLVRV